MATKITRKPSPAPANLRMSLDSENNNASVKAEWGVPADALWDTNHAWSALDEYWDFNASKNMSKTRIQQRGEGHVTADHIWVRDKGREHESNTMWYDRSKYHPVTKERYLHSITCQLRAMNGRGVTTISKTLIPSVPPKPKVEVEFDPSTGILTWTLTRPDLSGNQEMYDMYFFVTRQDNNWNADYKTEKRDGSAISSTQDEYVVTRNNWAGSIPFDAYIRWKLKAVSRGVKGESVEAVSQFVFAYPAKAQINKISKTSWDSDAAIRINIATNHNKDEHPVDSVKLQRLYNTAITSAASAGLSNEWQDVDGAVDDANCTGLCDILQYALPDVGKHTWYRLVTEHAGFERVGTPVMASCLDRTKDRLANDKVRFETVNSGTDGESVDMLIAWKNDDSTTTEVSWSTHENAWQSNEQADSMPITWQDSTSQVSGWAHSAHVTIRGIEQGKPLYVRARRVLDEGVTNPQYGPWCYPSANKYPITPNMPPENVVLTVPESVERGKGINCMWTFTGGEQTSWTVYNTVGSKKTVMASGVGSEGGCVIPANKLINKTSVNLSVSVSTGGDSVFSNSSVVNIMDRPILDVSVNQSLVAQPLVINLTGSSSVASVGLWVTSHGVGPNNPMADNDQPAGDILWSTVLIPEWVSNDENGSSWSASVTAPLNIDFRDGAGYTVTAISTVGGLSSDEVSADFVIAWAHQAVFPDESSTIVPNQGDLTATIVPVAPVDAAETDVCDIYRGTPDGYYLIAEGVQFGSTVVDPYAPFSNLPDAVTSYLLCTRTIDGDIEWREVEYEMKASILRLDWDGTSVELPYNVTNTTSFEKQFELQRRLDGSQIGGWDAGASRTEQITLDLARNSMWDEAKLIRQLGKYSGPCFVRSHDGCAYEADVQVDSMELSYNSGSVPISLRIQEIELTDEFKQQQTNAEDGD